MKNRKTTNNLRLFIEIMERLWNIHVICFALHTFILWSQDTGKKYLHNRIAYIVSTINNHFTTYRFDSNHCFARDIFYILNSVNFFFVLCAYCPSICTYWRQQMWIRWWKRKKKTKFKEKKRYIYTADVSFEYKQRRSKDRLNNIYWIK